MPRIVILGCAGSGKTTLARQLGEGTGAPVISLDALWKRDWGEKDVPAFRELLKQAHAGGDWISDGNFALASFDIRLPRATLVVWLEPSRVLCAWRAVTRVFHRGSDHRIARLANVLTFIWKFDRINRPRIETSRIHYGAHVPVRRLSTNADIAAFVSSLRGAS